MNTIIRNDDKNTITIGTSPLAGNQDVKLSVDSLFGRHLAILGNAGSGETCTVSGVIRWSIEGSIKETGKSPNARFIILDSNGEYRLAFDGLDVEVKYCAVKVENNENNIEQLQVPAWMWTSQEWAGVLQASGKTQKPILREALRDLKSSHIKDETSEIVEASALDIVRVNLYKTQCFLREAVASQSYLDGNKTKFGKELASRHESMKFLLKKLDAEYEYYDNIDSFLNKVSLVLEDKKGSYNGNEYYSAFSLEDISGWQGTASRVRLRTLEIR